MPPAPAALTDGYPATAEAVPAPEADAGTPLPRAEARSKRPRLAVTLGSGYIYDPEGIGWMQAGGMALWDYEDVWGHAAPPPLRFKAEFAIGGNSRSSHDLMVSAGIGALYYLDAWSTDRLRPFIEGDIGGIYTAYRVSGQGLNVNFNPQAGIGAELDVSPGQTMFMSFRLHHVSNGGINRDNRGTNGVLLTVGWFF